MSKFKLNIKPVIHNKYVLYTITIIALLNIIDYANKKDYNSIFTLLIIGFITSFFNKNMVVILSISVILTYMLKSQDYLLSEGMENNKKSKKNIKEGIDKDESVEDEENKKDSSANMENDEDENEDLSKLPPDAKADLEELATLQKDIIDGFTKIEPMLSRAETFVDQFKGKYNK